MIGLREVAAAAAARTGAMKPSFWRLPLRIDVAVADRDACRPGRPTTRLMKFTSTRFVGVGCGARPGRGRCVGVAARVAVSRRPRAGGRRRCRRPRVAEAVADAVDEHALADLERRHHRLARDPVRLDEERLDAERQAERDGDDDDQLESEPPADFSASCRHGRTGSSAAAQARPRRPARPRRAPAASAAAAAPPRPPRLSEPASAPPALDDLLGRLARRRPRRPRCAAASASSWATGSCSSPALDDLLGAGVAALADAGALADAARAGSRAWRAARRRGRRPRCFSIFGECTGNVRSTPTPKDCLRTVNVSRAPWPWRLITTPSKTWVRRRVPSMTWKWTRTRSPAWNAGTRRSWARSRLSMTVLMAKRTAAGRRRGSRAEPLMVATPRASSSTRARGCCVAAPRRGSRSWWPDSSTSGTFQPRYSAGRV